MRIKGIESGHEDLRARIGRLEETIVMDRAARMRDLRGMQNTSYGPDPDKGREDFILNAAAETAESKGSNGRIEEQQEE